MHEVEDKNELLPWEMEGSTYNLDFIWLYIILSEK